MSALSSPSFGSLLRHHRLAAGPTQEELAERAGLSPRAIFALERGERHRPYRQTLGLLASALQLSPLETESLRRAAGYTTTPALPATGAVPTIPPLVGRSRELAAVERFLAGHHPPVLIFAGEPGIGKSRLLREAARSAQAGGSMVLRGGGQRRSGQEPYVPLLDALSHSVTRLSASRLRSALAGCSWLTRLLPELVEIAGGPLPTGALPADQERRLIFAAVARYLANIAGPAGTLLALDDLQWASADGLDLLASLLRAGGGAAIRVVAAYRESEVGPDHPMTALLAELAERELVEHLTVMPLADTDALALLDGLLGPMNDEEVKQRIVRRAGGVPFLLASCAHGLDAGDGAEAVPWTVAQSIRGWVAALPPPAREALRGAAIVGRVVERVVLLRALGSPEEMLVGLDTACRAQLLVSEGRSAYEFAHDVVREAIEADLGDAERMVLHRKLAEALEALPEGHPGDMRRAAELAWHFLEGDEPERALPYAMLAGDDAERVFAHADAEMKYRRALSLARHSEDEVREAEALERLGRVLTNMARYDEAIGVLEEAAQVHVRRGDLEAEGRAVAGIGLAHFNRGTHEEGTARVEPVLERLERTSDGASHLHSLVALSGAMARLISMRRGTDRLARFQRAADLARAAGDTELLVRIEPYRAYTLRNAGHLDEALRVFEEAIALAEAAGDLLSLVVPLGGLGWCRADRGDNEFALQASLRALQAMEPLGDPMELFTGRLALGERHFVLGNWQEARVQFEQAWEIALGTGPSAFALAPAFALAKLCFRQGDLAAADWYDSWARERTVKGETYWADHWRRFTLAERHILAGDAEAALAELRHYTLALEVDRPHLMALEAWAYLDMGNPVRAQQILASAADLAHAQNNRNCLLQVLRVQAMLHAASSRSEPAEATWHDVLSMARGMPYPYFEAQALLEGALLRAGRGGYQEARADLAQAQAIFQRLGAQPDVARTQAALAALL